MNTSRQNAVKQQSESLWKELRLIDLAFMQVLLVASPGWVGTAAKQGPTHIVFWFLALLLFFLPEALVVSRLSRSLPLEGGIYQWAKLALGPFAGFFAAWNFWFFIMLVWATIGITAASNLSYIFGPSASWLASNTTVITVLNIIIFGLIWMVNVRGFRVSKWLTNIASTLTLSIFGTLILLLLLRPGHSINPSPPLFYLTMPQFSLLSVTLFSKMSFNALGGLDNAAVFAGESKNPERDLSRSVSIAAPVIAVLYTLGTGAILAYVSPANVDLIAPIPQVLSAAAGSSVVLGWLKVMIILVSTVIFVTQTIVWFAAVSRLPMVAGWDGLMPAWFTALHPRFKTPVRSISFVVLCSLGLGMLSLLGVREQEAFQLIFTIAFACAGIYYLVLFAIPLLGASALSPRPTVLLQLGALSGFVVTLLSIVCQLVPIVDVKHPLVFATKVGCAVAVANAVGVALYLRGKG